MAHADIAKDLWRYRDPRSHEAVSTLIRSHSTNPDDVREVVLSGVDFSSVREVLDLGCGYGFMAEAIARRLPPCARITGVDACRGNRATFEERVRTIGRRGKFIRMSVDRGLPWRDGVYDLVVSTYALYFFPKILPEIARVLDPAGRFLAVTHSVESVRAMFRLADLREHHAPWLSVINRFCSENGAELLGRHFERVVPVPYENELRFGMQEVDDLLRYLAFRLQSFDQPPYHEEDLQAPHWRELRRHLLARGEEIVMEKNDTAFWCSGPLWGEGMPGYDEWLQLQAPPAGPWST